MDELKYIVTPKQQEEAWQCQGVTGIRYGVMPVKEDQKIKEALRSGSKGFGGT